MVMSSSTMHKASGTNPLPENLFPSSIPPLGRPTSRSKVMLIIYYEHTLLFTIWIIVSDPILWLIENEHIATYLHDYFVLCFIVGIHEQ